MSQHVRPTAGRPVAGRRAARALAIGVLAGSPLLLAGPALAHVTVNPGEVAAGDFTKLAFRVPNESDTAGTTRLAVEFPTDTPLAFVSVKPHAGWTYEVARTTLPEPVAVGDVEVTEAVSGITWTAEPGTRIGPGQFDEFEVSVGPVPDAESLSFPTVQTYDDGEVAEWTQPVTAGGDEPEHPAPALQVVPASEADEAVDGSPTSEVTLAGAGTTPATASDDTARALGTAGLVVGALGLVASAVALAATRRRAGA